MRSEFVSVWCKRGVQGGCKGVRGAGQLEGGRGGTEVGRRRDEALALGVVGAGGLIDVGVVGTLGEHTHDIEACSSLGVGVRGGVGVRVRIVR